MAVLNREELLNRINDIVGEDTSDETLSLIEDISDTYDDMNNRVNDTEDWKTKYETNDREWRQKYKDRFYNTENAEDIDKDIKRGDNKEEEVPTTFEDLFN